MALIHVFLLGALTGSVLGQNYAPPQPSKPSEIKDFPGMVSLHAGKDPVCAGSIIDERHVLTTGRCGNELVGSSSFVRSGSSFVSSGGQTHNIVNITVHPSYHPRTYDYDIAVLTVDSATPLNQSDTVRLANSSKELLAFEPLSVYGWGDLQKNTTFFVEKLPFMESGECNRFFTGSFSPAKLVTERMMCTLIEPRFSKTSNYGSPVITASKKQVAISSWHRNRPEDIYTVYTDLTNQDIQGFISQVLSQ